MSRKIKEKKIKMGKANFTLKTKFNNISRKCSVTFNEIKKDTTVPVGKRGVVGLTLSDDLMFYEYGVDEMPRIIKAHCLILEDEIIEIGVM